VQGASGLPPDLGEQGHAGERAERFGDGGENAGEVDGLRVDDQAGKAARARQGICDGDGAQQHDGRGWGPAVVRRTAHGDRDHSEADRNDCQRGG
jgi:hypothetical protein